MFDRKRNDAFCCHGYRMNAAKICCKFNSLSLIIRIATANKHFIKLILNLNYSDSSDTRNEFYF